MWTRVNRFALSALSRMQTEREEGQALVEYTLILALVSIAAVALLGLLGTSIVTALEGVAEAV